MAIPLVSDEEGKLISSTIFKHNMSVKEKEQLLENYLLGRRIVSTQSVFSVKDLRK